MSKQYTYMFIAIVSGMVMLVLLVILYRCCTQVGQYTHIAVMVDPQLSQAAAVTIKKKLLSHLQTAPHYDLCRAMTSSFACIESIALDLYTPQKISYSIKAVTPCYAISDHLILGTNSMLFSKAWYHKTIVDALPTIATKKPLQAGRAPQGLCLLARHITPSILHEYDMVFYDETETRLIHKTLCDFSIVCNANCLENKHLYDVCKNIYTRILNRTVCPKQHTVAVQADVRFTHQIVVHTEQKRVRHV